MDNWKDGLVGSIKLASPTEFEEIKKNELKKPFSSPDSICRCVCTKCQDIFEANEELVLGLYRTMDLLGNLPEISVQNLKGSHDFYFELNYCHLEEKEEEVIIQLKKI
jgi:hypothetical protein